MPLDGSHGTADHATPQLRKRDLLVLDTAYLYKQMGLRGINASQLTRASGLPPGTLSHILRGQPAVRPSTMEKLAKGLAKFPVIEGIDPLLIVPDDVAELIGRHFSLRQAREMVATAVVPVRKRPGPAPAHVQTPPDSVDGLPVIVERPAGSRKSSPLPPSEPGRHLVQERRPGSPTLVHDNADGAHGNADRRGENNATAIASEG
jgi:helix-turn-helix protein